MQVDVDRKKTKSEARIRAKTFFLAGEVGSRSREWDFRELSVLRISFLSSQDESSSRKVLDPESICALNVIVAETDTPPTFVPSCVCVNREVILLYTKFTSILKVIVS